jgi:hypothetical protein
VPELLTVRKYGVTIQTSKELVDDSEAIQGLLTYVMAGWFDRVRIRRQWLRAGSFIYPNYYNSKDDWVEGLQTVMANRRKRRPSRGEDDG